ncbi:hypothetical protein KIN20_006543 [Parelaphostrongylus tenuis]|uniref:Uncharacterized protein n=1 Tax=Parelaphostrongylus tenuis TaxID=148309 RepID=A0AAD5MU85_PARTN|nr:hypothetical protein KIN20_006543 [Parelaphostrongylus tenuis]
MEPHPAACNQTTERVELIQHSTAGNRMAALADQLVLEFLVMELTEPPAAHLARKTEIEAQLEFIAACNCSPILKQQLGAACSGKLHVPENFYNRN